MAKHQGLSPPIYESTKDGNVFVWIIKVSEDYRKIRQRERFKQLEKITDTHTKNGNHGNNSL